MADQPAVDPIDQKVDEMLPMIRQAENSGDTAVSPRGAVGRYQIMPATAQALGHDPNPETLKDPAYNEQVARSALKDLIRQHGPDDTKALLAGYNASPKALAAWKASGPMGARNDALLPVETQHYFSRAGMHGAIAAVKNYFGHAPETTNQSEGTVQYQKLQAAGFTTPELDTWKQEQTRTLRGAGFGEDEIAKYWGTAQPNDDSIKRMVQNNLAQTPPAKQQDIVTNPMQAIEWGWRTSVAGLELRGQGPNMVLPENAGLFNKVAGNLTQSALDIPYITMGMVGGAAAGGAMGGPVGAVLGAGATGFALPQSMRSTLMEHYEHPDGYKTWGDFAGAVGRVTVDTMKAGATGAASLFIGGKAGVAAIKAGAGPLVSGASNLTAQAASATAVGSALDGHVPSAEDFITSAAVIIPFAAAAHVGGRFMPSTQQNAVAANLREVYIKTGITPKEATDLARSDPAIAAELLGRNAKGEMVTPKLDEVYKTHPGKIADEHEQMMNQLFTEAAQKEAQPKDVRSDEERAAKEAARQEYIRKKGAAQVIDFEQARTNQTLEHLGEPTHEMPPPSGPEPEVTNPEPGAKKVTDETIHLNDDMLADKLTEGKIGTQDRTSIWNNPETIYRQFVSELAPAAKLDRAIGTDPKQFGIEDAMRQTYASKERAGYFMRYGTLEPGLNAEGQPEYRSTGGPSYFDAYQAVKEDGGNYKTFEAYRIAKRTIDLAARGVDSGFDLETAKALVDKGADKYERGNQLVNDNKNAAIDYAVKSGVFSEAMAAGLKEANPSHIVLRRVTDPAYNPPRSRGFGVRQPVKKIKGSQLNIVDPTVADIENLHTILAMADRNNAVAGIVSAIEAHEAALPPEDRTFERTEAPAIGTAKAEILDAQGHPIPDKEAAALEPFIAERAFNSTRDANSFVFYREGKAEVWRTKDPELANMLRVVQPGAEANFFVKTLQAFARLTRLGITGAPDFPIRSNIRAQFEASIIGKAGGAPMSDAVMGLMGAIGKSEEFKAWHANGGLGAALQNMDTDYIQRDLAGVFEKTGTTNHVWNIVRHPLDALHSFRELVDSAARFGYSKRAAAQGMGPAKAATEGRVAYIDNAERAGLAMVNTFARTVPFFRTSILDVKEFGRAMIDRPVRTAAMGAMFVSLPTITNYLANYYADKAHEGEPGYVPYKELPRWQKDMFYVMPEINGVRLRLPLKPYVSSFVFGTLVERFLDHEMTNDPRAFKEWGDSFMAQFIPPVIPALALPVWEHYSNTRTLSNKSLIPANLEGASGYMQYTPDTSETAKGLSRLLSPEVGLLSQSHRGVEISPIVLENYAREWGGTLPFTILKTLETPWHKAAHPWTISDIPFVQSFVARNPGMGATSVQDFYEAASKIEAAHKDLALAVKNLNPSEIRESAGKVQAYVSLQNMKTGLTNMASVVSAINQNDKMTNAEKLKNIDALYGAMIETAKGGLKIADAINGK